MKNRKVVLFVTASVSMIQNWVVRLMEYMPDYTPLILHMSSLQNTKAPDVFVSVTYDVSKMSVMEIRNLIRSYTPSLCINLNFSSLLEQLVLRISKDEGIPTLYLEHGILNRDNEHFKKIKDVPNRALTMKRQMVMLWKTICYSLISPSSMKNIVNTFYVIKKNDFKRIPFDWYFVYGERCFDYLKHIYPSVDLETNTKLVGYPLFNTSKDVVKANEFLQGKKDGVLYVHQPFILDGITSISYDEEKEYIISLQKKYIAENGKFTILLHPRESLEKYQKLYKYTDIEVVLSPNDFKQFINCKLVIGHYSTALLYALYFNVLTYIIDYPGVVIQPIFKGIFPHFHIDGTPYKSSSTLFNEWNPQWLLGKYNTYEHIAEEIKHLIIE